MFARLTAVCSGSAVRGDGADGFGGGGDGRGVFARLTAGAGAVLGGLVTARCVFARVTAGC